MRPSGLALVLLGGGLSLLLAACSDEWRRTAPSVVSSLRGHWLLLHYGENDVGRWELSFSGGDTSVGAAFAKQPGMPHCFGRYSLSGRSVRFMLCNREYSGEMESPERIAGAFVGPDASGTWVALANPE